MDGEADPAAARTAPDRAVYLDANATERLRPEARDAALAVLAHTGNPASVHAPGRAARRVLEDARARLAAAFAVGEDDLVFTSGGTEANAAALAGLGAGRRVLVGATEHECVRRAAPSDAARLPVGPDGTVDPDALARALAADRRPALVALMLANNETGVLHPIEACAAICRRHGALLHVDAVQAAGRLAALPVPGEGGVTSLALSAHKMGGLAGAGALLLAPGLALGRALIAGAQELGRRGGTPSLPAIASFGAVAEARLPPAIGVLRDRIEAAARLAGASVAGAAAPRLANTACLVLPGRAAAMQLIALDLAGIAVSAGAACSSGRVGPSPVLAAMGLGVAATEAIRVSLSWSTTAHDARLFAEAYATMAASTAPRG